jgi:hypothetical protein
LQHELSATGRLAMVREADGATRKAATFDFVTSRQRRRGWPESREGRGRDHLPQGQRRAPGRSVTNDVDQQPARG